MTVARYRERFGENRVVSLKVRAIISSSCYSVDVVFRLLKTEGCVLFL